MSYLQPPPIPAPVVVVKDVGGFVTDYRTQTAMYRMSGREVRLHECRSACTLALSLPNVCVYPDSRLKFHLAYDPRNHAVNTEVSQQMFDSYPAPVQARLGTLTREYKVLRGDELIALGVRDCNAPKSNEPKLLVASAAPEEPALAAVPNTQMPSVFDIGEGPQGIPSRAAASLRPAAGPRLQLAEIPLPPQRPAEFPRTSGRDFSQTQGQACAGSAQEPQAGPLAAGPAQAMEAPLPPERRADPAGETAAQGSIPATTQPLAKPRLPAIIAGSQSILPPRFRAYAELGR